MQHNITKKHQKLAHMSQNKNPKHIIIEPIPTQYSQKTHQKIKPIDNLKNPNEQKTCQN